MLKIIRQVRVYTEINEMQANMVRNLYLYYTSAYSRPKGVYEQFKKTFGDRGFSALAQDRVLSVYKWNSIAMRIHKLFGGMGVDGINLPPGVERDINKAQDLLDKGVVGETGPTACSNGINESL